MEVFKAGEALMRSPPPLLLPFLAPTAYRAFSSTSSTSSASHSSSRTSQPAFRPRQWQSCRSRTFTTSSRAQQDALGGTSSTAPHQRRSASDDFSALLESALDGTKGTSTAASTRTSRFKSPSAQANNPSSRFAAANASRRRPGGAGGGAGASTYKPSPGSSVDEILSAMADPSAMRQQSSTSGYANIEQMLDPANRNNNSANQGFGPPPIPAPQVAPMQLGPRAGRTIHVNEDRSMDVGRAFRQLEIQCARNKVRSDAMRQRFHERGGLKRKRLKGERWRRRFREGFRGVVKLVQKMKKQGW